MKLRILAGLLLLSLSAPALAWWDTGHELVARIAWAHLSENERLQLRELLQHHPDPQVRDIVAASIWPDLIKSEVHPFHEFRRDNWHYQNRPVESEISEAPDAGRLLQSLEENIATLSDQNRPATERAVALSWVIHLVGDIHQPLHNATSYRPEFQPEGDRGGNRFKVVLGERTINLHTLWDSLGGRFLEQPTSDELTGYLTQLMVEYPMERFESELTVEEFKAWSDEGLQLAREEAYCGLITGRILSETAHHRALETTARRVTLAGYRLLKVLRRSRL